MIHSLFGLDSDRAQDGLGWSLVALMGTSSKPRSAISGYQGEGCQSRGTLKFFWSSSLQRVVHNTTSSYINLSLTNHVPIRFYSSTTIFLPSHVQLVHACLFHNKGIRLYSDVTVRNKVEEKSDSYTAATIAAALGNKPRFAYVEQQPSTEPISRVSSNNSSDEGPAETDHHDHDCHGVSAFFRSLFNRRLCPSQHIRRSPSARAALA